METMEAAAVPPPPAAIVTTPPEYCYDHQYLTGYLEDALVQFSVRFKRRRRLILPSHGQTTYQLCAPSPPSPLPLIPRTPPSPPPFDYSTVFVPELNYYWPGGGGCGVEEENSYAARQITDLQCFSDAKSTEEAGSAPTSCVDAFESSSCSSKDDSTTISAANCCVRLSSGFNCFSTVITDTSSPSAAVFAGEYCGKLLAKYERDVNIIDMDMDKQRLQEKKRPATSAAAPPPAAATRRRVAYPFAMVKPGGMYGDITLNEINKKLLMPPTRPVRHPVGRYACKPTVVSTEGRGLSGKAVVALTRIHTQGSGTITIIRTKG